jgi:hypothetical protein
MLQGIDPPFGNSLGVSQHISHPTFQPLLLWLFYFCELKIKKNMKNGQFWGFYLLIIDKN